MTWRLTNLARLGGAAIATLAGLAFLSTSDLPATGIEDLFDPDGINSVDGARRSLAYRLDSERATRFSFTGERRTIRLLTSASINEDAPIPQFGWTYGYRVAFLDGTEAVIEERDIYSLGVLPSMTEDFGVRRFLRTSDEQIAIQNEVIVGAPEGTAAVAVTALESDSGVRGIDIRVSERQPLTDSGALVAFLRRSPEEQRRLIGGSAFPADTLTEAEKVAVARNSWRPVGPSGIAGEAYELIVIYEVDLDEGEPEVIAAP